MKKLILALAIIVLSFTACTEKNPDGSIKLGNTSSAQNPSVVVIDSCEYIQWGYGLTHKGNCKFCAERRKKEYEAFLEDIVIELY